MTRHVMVVDDDASICEYMEMLLDMHSYQVSCWRSINGAAEVVRQQLPDVVIVDLDLGMRGIGWLLVEILHHEHPLLPLILYSAAHDVLDLHREALHAMGGTILYKPFEPVELLTKLRDLLAPKLLQDDGVILRA